MNFYYFGQPILFPNAGIADALKQYRIDQRLRDEEIEKIRPVVEKRYTASSHEAFRLLNKKRM